MDVKWPIHDIWYTHTICIIIVNILPTQQMNWLEYDVNYERWMLSLYNPSDETDPSSTPFLRFLNQLLSPWDDPPGILKDHFRYRQWNQFPQIVRFFAGHPSASHGKVVVKSPRFQPILSCFLPKTSKQYHPVSHDVVIQHLHYILIMATPSHK